MCECPRACFPFMVELLVPPACSSTLMSSKKEVLRQLSRLINHSFEPFNPRELPRNNFCPQYPHNFKKTSDENKDKYQLEDNKMT